MKTAKICYSCGEPWEHANEYNHLCSVCRYDNRIKPTKINKGEGK